MPIVSRKHLEAWPQGTGLDDLPHLVGLLAMSALARAQQIDLSTSGFQSPVVLATDPKQNELRYITKVEADAAAVGTDSLADIIPYLVRPVGSVRARQILETVGEQIVRSR